MKPAVSVRLDRRPGESSFDQAGLATLLRRAGLEVGDRVDDAVPTVELTLGTGGWQDRNLGALVAAARACPGQAIESGTAARACTLETAPGGPARTRPLLRAAAPPATLLLDRDGTILEPVPYLDDPARVRLLPGAGEGLGALGALDRRLVVLSNQSGVGRGRTTLEAVAAVNARMLALLREVGVRLDGVYCCPHAPDAGCDCRKPATGMARRAAEELGLDLSRALVVGDSAVDLGLARQLHVPAVLVLTGHGLETLAAREEVPDLAVADLRELARICAHPAGLGLEPVTPDGR